MQVTIQKIPENLQEFEVSGRCTGRTPEQNLRAVPVRAFTV